MNTKAELAEQAFIRRALASVERAEKFQRIKQIVVTVFAFAAAFWLAFAKSPSPELNVECTVTIMVGLMLAACTTKVLSLINKNTKAVLQAIAAMQQSKN